MLHLLWAIPLKRGEKQTVCILDFPEIFKYVPTVAWEISLIFFYHYRLSLPTIAYDAYIWNCKFSKIIIESQKLFYL